MKVSFLQAIKAINGKTAQEVYDALDFEQLPYDEENDKFPTLDDVVAALQAIEEQEG